MKKIKALAAITAILAVTVSTAVFAAPSPTAGVVTVVVPGSTSASAAEVKAPSQEALTELAEFIAGNAATVGQTASVKSAISIIAPKGYKGGNVPVVYAVAGLKDGAKNVFAYIRMANGKVVIVPCTVRRGYVGFIAPVFGDVAIVELNPIAAAASASAPAATAAPAKLH